MSDAIQALDEDINALLRQDAELLEYTSDDANTHHTPDSGINGSVSPEDHPTVQPVFEQMDIGSPTSPPYVPSVEGSESPTSPRVMTLMVQPSGDIQRAVPRALLTELVTNVQRPVANPEELALPQTFQDLGVTTHYQAVVVQANPDIRRFLEETRDDFQGDLLEQNQSNS